MVPLSPHSNPQYAYPSNLGKRTLSTVIGGPLAIGAIILGSPFVDVLALLLLGLLLWEWSTMSGLPLFHPMNTLAAVLLIWISLAPQTGLPPALVPSLIILFGLTYTAFYHHHVGARLLPSLILISGPLYIGLGMAAILTLGKTNSLLLLWGLLIVWATDTGAYIVGSLLGGPKFAPRISPGKTWSGVVGGSMIGTATGLTIAPYCQIVFKDPLLLLGLTFFLTIVSHSGDLLESKAKRVFNAKDSGNLIPGHGGIMDRLDSLLLVAFFLLILFPLVKDF
jgi:phosphatidate cytidylyltransferase